MSRREFTKPTKRAAYERSGGKCEADGTAYGLPPSQRCNRDLKLGVIYDHVDPDANSKDNNIENCKCICPACNRFKTYERDIPLIAKTDQQQDMARGISNGRRKWPKRKPYAPNVRDISQE